MFDIFHMLLLNIDDFVDSVAAFDMIDVRFADIVVVCCYCCCC